MIIHLLHISIDFEQLNIPHNYRPLIRNKLHTMRCMVIEGYNLLNLFRENKHSKIHILIRIAQFYKRFQLRNIHQTYNLTKEYQRKLILTPLIGHWRAFRNTYYEFKNMHLDRLGEANGVINEVNYTTDDIKIIEGFNPILEINENY